VFEQKAVGNLQVRSRTREMRAISVAPPCGTGSILNPALSFATVLLPPSLQTAPKTRQIKQTAPA